MKFEDVNANLDSALIGLYFFSGLVSGGINNGQISESPRGNVKADVLFTSFAVLGPRLTLFLGSLGYALYVGALWWCVHNDRFDPIELAYNFSDCCFRSFQTQGTRWFLIFAGGLLGISAALLWSAQGCIMMSYPLEKDKGKAFGIFWAIFQFGSFIGSVIALAINIRSGGLGAVTTSTYIAFLIIIFIGIASTALLIPPHRIIRGDGSLVKVEAASTPREELHNFIGVLKDWRMLALMPMFFSSNYFYAYQGAINTFYFDGATRASPPPSFLVRVLPFHLSATPLFLRNVQVP